MTTKTNKRHTGTFALMAIGCSLALLTSCKAPALTPEEKIVLPESYDGCQQDTASIASIAWEDFFPDQYLKNYIQEALNGNHNLQQTIEQVAIARAQLKGSRGKLLPDVTLGIGAGVERFGEYTMDGVGNSTTNTPDLPAGKHIPDPYKDLSLGLNFQWEIDILGKLNDKRRAAASRWMKSVEAERLNRTILISEVAIQYYNLIGLDRKERILSKAIEKSQESYLLTSELMKEGEVSRLSVDQFLSRRLKLEEMQLDVRQQIANAERAFALLLGRLPFEIERSSFDEVSTYSFPTEAGIPVQLIQNRPDIRAAELELMACKADVSAARKAFFPSLSIGGSGGFNAFNLEQWFASPASMVYNLAAGITAPIFRQNEIRMLWNESKSRQQIALLDYHYTVLHAYQEVTGLITSTQTLLQRKALKQEESSIHHRSIDNANELFKTGFVGYLDVLSADERYLNCELERVEVNIHYCQLHTLLYRALGGGSF